MVRTMNNTIKNALLISTDVFAPINNPDLFDSDLIGLFKIDSLLWLSVNKLVKIFF